jgi:hypothetical protein
LPVPLSPTSSTAASEAETRSSSVKIRRIASLRPTSAPKLSASDGGTRASGSGPAMASSVSPTTTTVPAPPTSESTRAPSKKVPLLEPRSRSRTLSVPTTTSRWRRDTSGSDSTSAASSALPTT